MIEFICDGDSCRIRGRLDSAEVRRLSDQNGDLLAASTGCLDLSELEYSDSAGIAFLLELWQGAASRGQALTLVNPAPQISKLIALYDLDVFFNEKTSK
ncbi:STAS domain-containing protein [Shewanella cyperi]|uniref:STAS domain-containing protein n=1 Tax=Shewanella cyperi TaxID=2814292 RepID=A0A975AJP9_9GAMM|nr:STAS domain-containing protein [Shewanella cyperi]QSX29532.1 STAS domain-containing protein [Shewanella cyperi]